MKYPNCPLCKDNMLRKERINQTSYWKCWSCKMRFDKDLLFVVIEIPKYRNDYVVGVK
jgi:ribosomal protein L37AE/L43A